MVPSSLVSSGIFSKGLLCWQEHSERQLSSQCSKCSKHGSKGGTLEAISQQLHILTQNSICSLSAGVSLFLMTKAGAILTEF